MTPFEPQMDFRPTVENRLDYIRKEQTQNSTNKTDYFVNKNTKSNPIIKMRNGFGKLMAHFSKSKVK